MACTGAIQHRRDTAANWVSVNPVLLAGQIGFETDTRRFKLGDGTTAWNSLGYVTDHAVLSGLTTGDPHTQYMPVNASRAFTVAPRSSVAAVSSDELVRQGEIAALFAALTGALGTMSAQNANAVAITGGTITGLGAPTASGDAAPKSYVDALVTGLSWKQSVRVATTANGTLASAFANGSTVDGVTLATGNRILLKNQTTATENGIYTVNASGAPTRATDADAGAELVDAACFVTAGTANAGKCFLCTNDTITIGSTSITWVEFGASATGALLAANNLSDLASASAARGNLGLAAIAASGSASDLSAGTVPAARMPALTGAITTSAGSVATTLASGAVGNSNLRNSTGLSVIGRAASVTGAPADIVASANGVLRELSGTLGFGLITGDNVADASVGYAKLDFGGAANFVAGSDGSGNPTRLEIGADIAAAVHTHDAADVVSGTLDRARLGSGATGGTAKFLREDSTWATPAGGSSPNYGTATVDFGSGAGSCEASVVVTGQTTITNTSRVEVFVMGSDSTADHTANDHRYLPLLAAFTAGALDEGVGFTIYATALDKLTGQFQVRWRWQ